MDKEIKIVSEHSIDLERQGDQILIRNEITEEVAAQQLA